MTYEETLRTQWNKLREEMVELMRFLEKNLGRLDFAELNRVYRSKTLRWSSQMQAEGRWLADIENEQMKAEFKDALAGLSLTEVRTAGGGSGGAAVLAAVVAGCLGGGVGNAVRGLTGGVILCAVAFAGAFVGVNQMQKSKRTAGVRDIEAAYVRQIEQGLETAAAVLRRYD